jgi:CBS domain-containing protein
MNVGTLCQRNVVTVGPGDELSAAARLMRERHIGYLVVVEGSGAGGAAVPVGVLTDRDMVVSIIARDAESGQLKVGDVMTRNPVAVAESESLATALRQMRSIGVRRVPVVGKRGELTGLLSLDDVLDRLVSELQDVVGAIQNERRIEGELRR